MKEKTLYYRIIVREVNRMINDGFIIVTIYDGELLSLEGVLAEDYLTARIDDDAISIEYYSRHEVFGEYEKQWEIPLQKEYFEMPLYIEADVSNKQDYMTMDEDEEEEYEEYEVVQIETIEQIFQNSQKERCNVILQEFKKNNNVFN